MTVSPRVSEYAKISLIACIQAAFLAVIPYLCSQFHLHRAILAVSMCLVLFATVKVLKRRHFALRVATTAVIVLATAWRGGWLAGMPFENHHELFLGGIAVVTYFLFEVEHAGALSSTKNLAAWVVLGAVLLPSLAYMVYLTVVYAPLSTRWLSFPIVWGVSSILVLLWASPVMCLMLFAPQRYVARIEFATSRKEFDKAEYFVGKAYASLAETSSVDRDWNRMMLLQAESALRRAQGRQREADDLLRQTGEVGRELGVVRRISRDSRARRASDNAASETVEVPDTISARSL